MGPRSKQRQGRDRRRRVSQPFTIQNQSIASFVPYLTTATAAVAQQSSAAVNSNQFTYTLPAQSITTFVQ